MSPGEVSHPVVESPRMAKEVRSVFRVRLEPGETKFSVKLPYQAKGLANANYAFDSLNITPDFYSKKAAIYKFDSKSEDASEVQYNAKVVFSYGDDVYARHEYTQPENNMTVANLIKSINDHFELHKPASFTDSWFFIDWAHVQENKTDLKLVEFYKQTAQLFYDEDFDEAKHWNALPASARNITGVNNFLFPTTDDPEVLSDIRIRLWSGPNTTISFSSDNILQALGFQTEEMGKRGDKNRFHFKNADAVGHRRKRPISSPLHLIRLGGGRSKIYVSTALNQVISETFKMKTNKLRERSNVLLAEDLNQTLKIEADYYSMAFGLEFKPEEKIFKFRFPVDDNVKIRIKVPLSLARRLGYGERDLIEKQHVPDAIADEDGSDYEQRARTLVFDTGLTAVTLDQRGSYGSYGLENELMAVLFPQDPGILKAQSKCASQLTSHHGDELTFSIWRISEDNQSIPLSWKCGAYVEGLLIGKV